MKAISSLGVRSPCIVLFLSLKLVHYIFINNGFFFFLISEARLAENGHEYHKHYSSMSKFSTEHFLVLKTHFGLPQSASFHLVVAFISDE